MPSKPPPFDVVEASALVRQLMNKSAEERARWGNQGPPVNELAFGQRIVASYNELLTIESDATYHEFLEQYVQRVFDNQWWKQEAAKGDAERHIVVTWHLATQEYFAQNRKGTGQLVQAPMPGETAHLLRLAFNLHQIKHLGLLQTSLLKRLKTKDQFQGGLYEVEVCASFVRGGFSIAHEPEGKGPHRLCEFVATHTATGKSYSIEAKSRHIPGVLGHPADAKTSRRDEPNVSGLIRNALGKEAAHDRIICVDVNFPQLDGTDASSTWGRVIREQVNVLETAGLGPAMLICTNSPFHYLQRGQAARGQAFMMMGLGEPRFQPQDKDAVEQDFPGTIAALAGFSKHVPGTWE